MIDQRRFRDVLGHYPTGVCAITATEADGAPVVMIVGSFSSVSLEPPLIAFFPDRKSTSWPRIEAAGRFCVNILGADQQALCAQFASKVPDKFADVNHSPSALGSPIVEGAVAWIDCDLHAVHEAGDHFIVLGEVRDLQIAGGGNPLVFHRGSYGSFLSV